MEHGSIIWAVSSATRKNCSKNKQYKQRQGRKNNFRPSISILFEWLKNLNIYLTSCKVADKV